MSDSDSQPVPELEPMLAHSAYVRALARELVYDAALARDVEQETWLVAMANAPRDPAAQRGWLATIVRNLAFKAWRSAARRRTRETVHARAKSAVPTPAEVLERADLHRSLVESLNALDEPYRAALVLRYLEGLPPREVARELGVPVETVRTRIKRGLELLRARLDRASRGDRGAWCLLFVRTFRLGPPSTAQLATSILSTSLGVTGILAMSLVVLCGTVFLLSRSAARLEPAPSAGPVASLNLPSAEPWPIVPPPFPAGARTPVQSATPAPAGDDLVRVTGRVLDPDGKPKADADVYLTRWHWDERYPREPLASMRSDAQGRFALSFSKSDRRLAVDAERPEMWRVVSVCAFAPGFGPAWSNATESGETELTLVRDLPVRGRVLDLEGQPVAGARVSVSSIDATAAPESLDGFLADPAKPWNLLSRGLQLPPAHPIACETRPDGSFELSGIGRERHVFVDVRGPTIAQASLRVVTRPIETVTWEAGDMMSMKQTLHGSELDWIARPTRPVCGVVRDASTQKALAGVKVTSRTMSGLNLITTAIATTTDAEGRFELLGMPKGPDNSIRALPNDEQPYFMQDVELSDPAGMTPIEVEIELHRGVWITGHLTDGEKPAYGRIHYLPYLDNPHAQKLKEFDPYSVHGDQKRYKTDADGNFRIVGLPGRAILGVTAIGAYCQGAGSEEIEGANEEDEFQTYSNPLPASRRWPTSMRALDVPIEAGTTVCDLQLDRGASLAIELAGPDGKPLAHCSVNGRAGRSNYDRADDLGPHVEVENLGPDERRLLRIHNDEHDLGFATFVSRADEGKRIELAPCATIFGRLLDQAGAPIADAVVKLHSGLDFDPFIEARSDGEGRFRFEHMLPGVAMRGGAAGLMLDPESIHTVLPEWLVVAGATKDLGDIRLKVR